MATFWNEHVPRMQQIWHKSHFMSYFLACIAGFVLGLLCTISPILAIALTLGLIILFTSIERPVLLCYWVIGAIILTSGIERGRFIPLLSINEVALLGAVAISILVVLTDRQRKIVLPRYFVIAFFLLVGGTVILPIITFSIQGTQLTMSNAFKIIAPVQYFFLFWLFAALPENEADRRKIIWWMLAFGLIVAVIGLLQGAGVGVVDRLLESLFSSSQEAMAERAGRITSLMGSWNTLGILMMTILFISWAVLFEVDNSMGRVLILGVMAFSALCLLASGSYAGIGLSIVGIIILQILSQRKAKSMPILVICFIGAILAVFLFYPLLQPLIEKRLAYQFREGGLLPQTLTYRFKIWREIFIPAIQQHFPWPVYPTVPSNYAWQFEESQYILLLFRTGLAGFVSYLLWIGFTIRWLLSRIQHSQGFNKAIASVPFTLIIMLVIAGFTNEVFSFSGTIDFLWIMLGLVANGMERI